MPFQGFPLLELRELKKKPQNQKGFLYKESC